MCPYFITDMGPNIDLFYLSAMPQIYSLQFLLTSFLI